MKPTIPVPHTRKAWLKEIAAAYLDAKEALPFQALVGVSATEKDLFHLGPVVCLKFRGIKRTDSILKKATGAALASYVATEEIVGDLFDVPQMAFAFCYVASHTGQSILDDEKAIGLLDYLEQNLETLVRLTEEG